MRYDILVIGAGPVGSVAAGHLAAQGHSVLLIEEHRAVGKPMQCGGLVSPRIRELVDFSFPALNTVKGAHVHSPEGTEFRIRATEDKGIVLDRTDFDERAAQWAVEKGASLHLGSRVKQFAIHNDGVRALTAGGKTFTAELVLGADGPTSLTARSGGLPGIREIITGYEIEAIGRPRDLDMVEVFVGQKVGRGFFSWAIPSGEDRLRIGTGVHSSSENAFRSFHHLIKGPRFRSRFEDIQPISMHGGGIPMGMRDRMYSDRLLVLGDAAGLAKPVSGGGVITGLISARIAAQIGGECLTDGRCSARDLAPYQKLLLMEVGKEMSRAWKLRKTFMYLSDQELEQLFSLLTRPEVLRIINERGDIDYPGRVSMELLRASPGLLKFAFRYLGAGLL